MNILKNSDKNYFSTGIPPHVDTHSVFERTILSLSLGSSYVMEFRRGEQKFFLDLPARSLLIMSGQARYGWTHGICPRQSDEVVENCGLTNRPRGTRVSFTFRKVRKSEKCDCEDIEYCDNHVELKSSIDNHIASKLEHSYVHDVSFFKNIKNANLFTNNIIFRSTTK